MKKSILLSVIPALGTAVALSMVPLSAQTDTQDAVPLKQCVQSMGMQTEILNENTILATGTGKGGVVIDVRGCRLHPSDILVLEYRGTNQICGPMDVQISVRDSASSISAPCFIQSVKAVTKDEAKALTAKK